jgi:hypothetical protein
MTFNQVLSKFNELNIFDKDSVPRCIIEGWTSGNDDIDEFIKDTIYNAKLVFFNDDVVRHPLFLEWVPFNRLKI